MIEVATETIIEQKINSLTKQAWDFGVDCEADGIRDINEGGDSHIEWMRDKLEAAKDELFLLLLKEVGVSKDITFKKFAVLTEKEIEAKHFSAGFTEGQADGLESARMLVAQCHDLDVLKQMFEVL